MKKIIATLLAALVVCATGFYFAIVRPAMAGVSCSLPFTLTNGTIADASQVMANYNALVTCLTNAAAAGANNDITSLSALTTPITPGQGGSNVYIAQNPVVTTGPDTAKNLVISGLLPTGYANVTGQSVIFVSPFTNIASVQAIVNGQATKQVFKQTQAGPVALTGGEIVTSQVFQAIFDGTQFEINPFPNVTAGWGIAVAPTAVSINTKNPPYGFGPCVNMTVSATVGSGLLGVQLFAADTGLAPTSTHPILCNFRDSTIANGDPAWVSVESAVYMDTNAVGATLGVATSTAFRLWVVAFNNAGTVKLALWHSGAASTTPQVQALNEGTVQSTTGISNASTSAGTFYTPNGTSLSSKSFRILGYMDWANGLATVGNYSSGPTTIQLFGPGVYKPGDVLQTIYSTSLTSTTPTGANRTITGLNASITPSAKVDLILARAKGALLAGASQNITSAIGRGTAANFGSYGRNNNGNAAQQTSDAVMEALDQLQSTSSTTYSVYVTGSSSTVWNNDTIPTSMILQEIAP